LEPTQISKGLHYNGYERFLILGIDSGVAENIELRAKVVIDSGMFRSHNYKVRGRKEPGLFARWLILKVNLGWLHSFVKDCRGNSAESNLHHPYISCGCELREV
jgi:hypothetical protein